MAKQKKQTIDPIKFSKNTILESDQFNKIQKDFLSGLLKENDLYTLEEAQAILDKKLKGAVK